MYTGTFWRYEERGAWEREWSARKRKGPNHDWSKLNPLHPNISMHILHTVLYTFPMVLTRRISLTIQSFCSC